jgi:membrane associated rhomboid family serine protease
MPPSVAPSLESILQSCADAAPQPWRPANFARTHGLDRDALDDSLNRLRIAGLVKLTDWEPGVGQGYVLTDVGRSALTDPDVLEIRLNAKPESPFRKHEGERNADRFARGEQVRAAVFDYHAAPVNKALIVLQVVMFAVGLYFALQVKAPPDSHLAKLENYLTTGNSPFTIALAVAPPHLTRGEWWTLLTYALVHAGGLHLLLNLMSHGALGPGVEGMFGSWRFLVIWLISAMGGGVAVAIRGQVAVGSSGAICGLIGAQAAFVAIYHPHIGKQATAQFRNWLIKTAIIIAVLSSIPWVSGAAHLGGAIGGALAGALLAVHRFGPSAARPLALLGVIALPALSIVYLTDNGILDLALTGPQIAGRERLDFNRRLRPIIQSEEESAHAIDENTIDPLRSLRPEQRSRDTVRGAIHDLKDLRDRQMRLLNEVLQTGRYRSEAVERARQAAEDLLKLRAGITHQYEEFLDKGAGWSLDKDENLLQSLLNQAVEAEIAYRRAVKEV